MPSALDDAKSTPDDAALARVLADAKPHWDEIVAHLDSLPGVTRAWRFYGAKHGWQLKAERRKRALLYLIPEHDRFTAATALKGDVLPALRASALPAELVREIERARIFVEGRPARVVVTRATDVAVVRELVAIQLRG